MLIALLVIGLVLGYTLVGAASAKAAKSISKWRGWDHEITMVLVGGFWPVGWPIVGLVLFARGAYWLFDEGCDALTGAVAEGKRRRLERRTAKALPPAISVPRGAVMTPEAYRILKPMVQEFERALPVPERE